MEGTQEVIQQLEFEVTEQVVFPGETTDYYAAAYDAVTVVISLDRAQRTDVKAAMEARAALLVELDAQDLLDGAKDGLNAMGLQKF